MHASQTTQEQSIEAGPTVSVIMPCYNSGATIRESIASVQSQTLEDWELIVVDDGSDDATPDIVSAIADPRITLLRKENGGAASARNQGLVVSRGQFIAFLDSDDLWEPEFLKRMLEALSVEEDAVLAYCGWQNLSRDGENGRPFIPPDYESLSRAETFLGGCRWPIHGVLVRRSAIDKTGGFDETLYTSEDYELWLRIVHQGKLIRVPEVLAYYLHHEGTQITDNPTRVALNHLRAQENFLVSNPDAAHKLGEKRIRELLDGELLRRAYICYWNRDLQSARTLFRHVMRRGYGRPKDWLYMLPSLLPLNVHAWLLNKRDGQN